MQVRVMLVLCISVLFLSTVYGQVPSLGKCPGVQVVQNFNAANYLGRWYEYEKYPFIFEAGGRCVYAEYGSTGNGHISVYNAYINLFNNPSSIKGVASTVSPAKLAVTFPDAPFSFGEAPYWVLGTDYNNYAVVFSCSEYLNIGHTQVVWVLTRSRKPSQAIITTAHNVIERNGLQLSTLNKTDQENCPEFI